MGEIRRVLNSFLQFLEQLSSNSIVVAATNLRSMLDEALFRRFDAVLEYDLPTESMIVPLILNRLSMFDTSGVAWDEITSAALGLSHADIVRAAEEAAKEAVLDDRIAIRTDELARAVQRRQSNRTA